MPKPIPDGFRTVTPHLRVKGAAAAIEFYKKAFGAEEWYRMPAPDGSIVHAEIRIGDSVLMLADEMPQYGALSPSALKGTSVGLHVYVADCDAAFQRAVAAGATPAMPPVNMFWGDRYGKVVDPFGHEWSIATHIEDLMPEEVAKRAEATFKDGMCG